MGPRISLGIPDALLPFPGTRQRICVASGLILQTVFCSLPNAGRNY